MSFPMPKMNPCYFCEAIASDPEAWNFVAVDELTVTLLNGRQFEEGQCIVVPRRAGSDWGIGPPHIARLEANGQQPRFDHSAVTEDKLRTVLRLRQHFE